MCHTKKVENTVLQKKEKKKGRKGFELQTHFSQV